MSYYQQPPLPPQPNYHPSQPPPPSHSYLYPVPPHHPPSHIPPTPFPPLPVRHQLPPPAPHQCPPPTLHQPPPLLPHFPLPQKQNHPPLPPPLPPSHPPTPPPPPPPARPPDHHPWFPQHPREPEFHQERLNFQLPHRPPEQSDIPPLFPRKEITSSPAPKPLFPPHEELPQRDEFSHAPQSHYDIQHHRPPVNQSHRNDERGDHNYSPNRYISPPREHWSPPQTHYTGSPQREPTRTNFDHEHYFNDSSAPCNDERQHTTRFEEVPKGQDFRPLDVNFRPVNPPPDQNFQPHQSDPPPQPNISEGGCNDLRQESVREYCPPCDHEGNRLSPTRRYFYNDCPPEEHFSSRSPRFDERPHDRPPNFDGPPNFNQERPPDFDRVPEFDQPHDFTRPPDFIGPPDYNKSCGVYNSDDFRHTPPPPTFHHDNLVDNFRAPHHHPDNHHLSVDHNEGEFNISPHHGGQEYHNTGPPENHKKRLPLLPTPLMGPNFPMPEIKTVSADKIFDIPGRAERPSHIVIILRGLPGSGKSHIAKLIREKEISHNAPAPRLLSLDSYFLSEVEKTEKDPETGRRVKKRVQEYEYEPEMEQAYRASLLKTYHKTLEEGFFPMIVVDAPNTKVHYFDRYWSSGKMKGFEVYIVELIDSVDICVARNIHHRSREDIDKLAAEWEETPPHFTRLDITALLSDSNIDEVEMECTGSESEGEDKIETKSQNRAEGSVVKSRWEDASEERLDKLDAVGVYRKRKRLHSEVEGEEDDEGDANNDSEGEELSLLEYLQRRDTKTTSGKKKKRVRWADLEAKKDTERKRREVGFCIGGSWGQVTDEEAHAILTGTNTTDTS